MTRLKIAFVTPRNSILKELSDYSEILVPDLAD
jgi:hypothetical protein